MRLVVCADALDQDEVPGPVVVLDAVLVVDQAAFGNGPVLLLPDPAVLEHPLAAGKRETNVAGAGNCPVAAVRPLQVGFIGVEA